MPTPTNPACWRTWPATGLVSLKFVAAPLASSTHDMALVSVLEKPEDVAGYSTHPAHVAVADTYVRPYTCQRAALDYED